MIGTGTAIALGLLGAGTSAASGALSNRSRTGTQTQTTTPTLDPAMQPLQGAQIDALMKRLINPGAGMQPLKTAAIDGVNKTYSAIPQRMTEMLASRGLNNSGVLGKSIQQAELGRASEVAGTEAKFAGMQLDEENRIMQLINQMLSLGRGSTTTGTTTTPGNMLGGAFGGLNEGMGDMASLMIMNSMLGKAGGGGGWERQGLMPGLGAQFAIPGRR